MEDSEDSSSDSEAEYSAIDQPTILEQLKSILGEYRNDVQIIKELVQNADDANATLMQVFYQHRPVNRNVKINKSTRNVKFLQGPALVVHNDAIFREKDWEGVRKIYASIKRNDPFKIGKFGLGFKSIFHLTDWPCIISADKILLIDPLERKTDRICQFYKLDKIHSPKCKRFNHSWLAPLFNLFSFSEEILRKGHYNGTIFWFPLRTQQSKLSANICTEEQIGALFNAFIEESRTSLLFLKSICKVELLKYKDGGSEIKQPEKKKRKLDGEKYDIEGVSNTQIEEQVGSFYTVTVEGRNLYKERKSFLQTVSNIGRGDVIAKDTTMGIKVIVKTTGPGDHIPTRTYQWFLLTYLKGHPVSQRVLELLKDDDICSPHLVGLAAPILPCGEYSHDNGHVFCYQPLPRENKHVTGLPLHVNAFFALSQNRRHIKWPDSGDSDFLDKDMEWNLALANEMLPNAYLCLVEHLITLANEKDADKSLVQAVYYSVPNLSVVDDRWKEFAETSIQLLKECSCLLTARSNWVSLRDSVIYHKKNHSKVPLASLKVVEQLAKDYFPNLVSPESHVVDAFEKICEPEINFLTPALLHGQMLKKQQYTHLSRHDKLHLLTFLTENDTYDFIDGLDLLPLASNTFDTFSRRGSTVFLEEGGIIKLFPSHKELFVAFDIGEHSQLLHKIKNSGLYQLSSIKDNIGAAKKCVEGETAMWKQKNWIRDIWETFIFKCFPSGIDHFKDISIFPVNFSSELGHLETVALDTILLIAPGLATREHCAKKCVEEAFAKLGVIAIETVPNWLSRSEVQQYLFNENSEALWKLLDKIEARQVECFNNSSTAVEKDEIRVYFSQKMIDSPKPHDVLKQLEIFQIIGKQEGEHTYTSIETCPKIAYENKFPVNYPFPVLKISSPHEKNLALKLDAVMYTDSMILKEALPRSRQLYTDEEVKILMNWLLVETKYLNDRDISKLAENVSFLDNGSYKLSRARDLFDPTNETLTTIFKHENVFPNILLDSDLIIGLKKIGLKQPTGVTASDLERVITDLDQLSQPIMDDDFERARSLADFVNTSKRFLADETEKIASWKNKKWIPVHFKGNYADRIPLQTKRENVLCSPDTIKSDEFVDLIGSIFNVHDCKSLPHLASFFGWTTRPCLDDVLDHLLNTIHHYHADGKASCLQMISHIYKEIANTFIENSNKVKAAWMKRFPGNTACIWHGDGFSPLENMFMNDDDPKLQPYLYALPNELLVLHDFLQFMGCASGLKCESYLSVLKQLKDASDRGEGDHRKFDMTIAILHILKDKFSEECQRDKILRESLFLPVKSKNGPLNMKHIDMCAYLRDVEDRCSGDGNNDEEDEDIDNEQDLEVYFVHPDIPYSTAKALGVGSFKQQLLSDADTFEEWGQEEPLTRRIYTLLKDGYVDGFSVAKELFQNANDAEASKLHILYDERSNEDYKKKLINSELAEWQGPAIWVFNDAEFTEEDFKNITKLNGGTKEKNTKKIGKFGLGFCSVYNITDVPSFISGENYVIFDPHTTNLGKALQQKSPGLRMNFGKGKNQKVLRRIIHQFQIFNGVFNFHMTNDKLSYFKGTLFRLPLRKRGSQISNQVYTHDEVRQLFHNFTQYASNMFIFTHNVNELKLYHLKDSANPTTMSEIYCVTKSALSMYPLTYKYGTAIQNADDKMKDLQTQIGEDMYEPFLARENIEIVSKKFRNSFLNFQDEYVSCHWSVSWATSTYPRTLHIARNEEGALPLASVALPFLNNNVLALSEVPDIFYRTGHFFFYLPLPVQHHYKFHINSQFNVTSDRSGLRDSTEDEKSQKHGEWNICLMSDPVTLAILFLLESNQHMIKVNPFDLWPREYDNTDKVQKVLCESFYKRIIEDPNHHKIFYCPKTDEFCTFSDIVFLDPDLHHNEDVGDVAFQLMVQSVNCLVDIPEQHYKLLEKADEEKLKQKTVPIKRFILDYFLKNIAELSSFGIGAIQRDKLMCYILEFHCTDEEIQRCIRETPCIPVQQNGKLKRPSELIHPHDTFSNLFKPTDEVFPEESFSERLDILCELGMVHEKLPNNLVIDRTETVSLYAQQCMECALLQSQRLVSYLFSSNTWFVDLYDVKFLPALPKPSSWPFPWASENIGQKPVGCHDSAHGSVHRVVCSPKQLFPKCELDLVGCIYHILDEDSLKLSNNNKSKLPEIGINQVHDYRDVIDQLIQMSEYEIGQLTLENKSEATRALESVYKYLNSECNTTERKEFIYEQLGPERHNSVFMNDHFVNSQNVAVDYKTDCRPILYHLKDSPLRHFKKLVDVFKVRDAFDLTCIVGHIERLKNRTDGLPMEDDDFKVSLKLLEYIDLLNYSSIPQQLTIYAPDEMKVLRPSKDLCFNDCDDIEKSEKMIYINDSVTPRIATTIGVKRKQIKHFEENSEDMMVSFYQEESLVTRLKNLIEGYPCDISIFRELLQNADDAESTEIHFILDKTTHKSLKILDKKMQRLQGPALCVYNDSSFTKNDLDGIQKLGQGSKGKDPSKTGKYGVGFNVVYHLTDAPSFISKGKEIENGETLCFFDPLAKHIPSVTKCRPGKRVTKLDDFKKMYPDTMSSYHYGKYLSGDSGTMFRLPLRCIRSDIKDETTTVEDTGRLLQDFIKEMPSLLLFLRNLTRIKVVYYDNFGYHDQSEVRIHLEEIDKCNMDSFRQTMKEVQCNRMEQSLSNQQTITEYKITLQQRPEIHRPIQSVYYIVHALRFSEELDKKLKEAIGNKKLEMIPHAAIAYKVPETGPDVVNELDNKVYCYLPICIKSGLPVNIQGNFALGHESRRDLWFGEEMFCYKTSWNESLIKFGVCDAYIGMLNILKKCTVDAYQKLPVKYNLYVKEILLNFEKVFPHFNKAQGHYWYLLTKFVYKKLAESRNDFLPVISQTCEEKTLISELKWTALYGEHFHAYHSDASNEPDDKSYVLNNILRKVGMRIVTVCPEIRESMDKAGIPIKLISPNEVTNFLVSHKGNWIDKCLIEVGKPLKDTALKTLDNVLTLFSFLREYLNQSSQTDIEKVPIFVTQDNTLKCLENCSQPLFVTKFVYFFPEHISRFLHRQFSFIERIELMRNTDKLVSFQLKNFVELCMDADFVEKEYEDYVVWNGNNPDDKFLKQFWIFFNDWFKRRCRDYHFQRKQGIMSTMLEEIKDVSLIMALDGSQKVLCSTSKLFTLLNMASFSHETRQILEKAKLPTLCMEYMDSVYGTNYNELIRTQTAGNRDLLKILDCFVYHKKRLVNAQFTDTDVNSLLRYFISFDLKTPKLHSTVQKFKQMPFYVTVDNQIRSISDFNKIYVVPNDLPKEGLDKIMKGWNIGLVKRVADLEGLYVFLGIEEMDWHRVYERYIFPFHQLMDRTEFYTHIKFLAEKGIEHNSDLLRNLKQTKFIETKGHKMACAHEFFDHTIELFLLICDEDELLPDELRSPQVTILMRQLELKTSCSMEDMCRFANIIEKDSESIQGFSLDKSKLLVQMLKSMPLDFFQNNLCDQLSTIRFVPSMGIDFQLTSIYRQYKPSPLIAYRGSIPADQIYTCWTTDNLICKSALPRYPEVWEKLGICKIPSTCNWVQHAGNVGASINDKLNSQYTIKMEDSFLQMVMGAIYSSVPKDVDIQIVKQIPLIYFSDKGIIVKPKHVVNECSVPDDELPPYLRRAPICFGKFFSAFISLGSWEKITCHTLADVLNQIKEKMEQGNIGLLPNEVADAEKAMVMLVKLLTDLKDGNEMESVKMLHFLYKQNDHMGLENTTSLVLNNNDVLYRRVQNGADRLKYVKCSLKSGTYNVKRDAFIECIKWLPESLRPHMLTDVMHERLDKSQITYETCTSYSIEMEQYLHSTNFCNLFFRLAKHCMGQQDVPWSQDNNREIVEKMRNMKFRNVRNICTSILISSNHLGSTENLRVIPNTSEDKNVYIDETTNEIIVYHQTRPNSESEVREHLCIFLDKTFDLKLGRLFFVLDKMLNKDNTVQDLMDIMDKEYVDVYESNIQMEEETQCPRPGTFVPTRLHPYLCNDYGIIEEHDYKFIAHLVEDPLLSWDDEDNETEADSEESMSQRTPTYIFVHIIRKLPDTQDKPLLLHDYEVDVGEETLRVIPAYLLFKFVRNSQPRRTVEVYAGLSTHGQPIQDVSIKDICKEICRILTEAWKKDEKERKQIVRRLLLKWHPDKNPVNEAVATKVFQYIQQCLQCLENGKDIPEYKEKNASSTGSSFGRRGGRRSYWGDSWYGRYWRRWSSYNRSHSSGSAGGNFDDFFTRTGHDFFSSSSSEYKPYKFKSEARRWLEQAKYDVNDAKESLTHTGHTNNLICFKGHQAAEKALKGGWYAEDANKIKKYSHSLSGLASGLGERLEALGEEIERITGQHSRMRYPDTMTGTLPATAYTREQAQNVTRLAEEIIDEIKQKYQL